MQQLPAMVSSAIAKSFREEAFRMSLSPKVRDDWDRLWQQTSQLVDSTQDSDRRKKTESPSHVFDVLRTAERTVAMTVIKQGGYVVYMTPRSQDAREARLFSELPQEPFHRHRSLSRWDTNHRQLACSTRALSELRKLFLSRTAVTDLGVRRAISKFPLLNELGLEQTSYQTRSLMTSRRFTRLSERHSGFRGETKVT